MTIDIWGSLKTTVINTVGTGTFYEFFKSTFIASCIITICTLLVILQVYPAKKGLGVNKLIKLAFWITVASSIVMFFHDTIRAAHYEKERTQKMGGDIADTAFTKENDVVVNSVLVPINNYEDDRDDSTGGTVEVHSGKAIKELDSIIYAN